MKKFTVLLLALTLIIALLPVFSVSAAGDVTVYMSADGDDTGDGSKAKPVKTFAGAAALAKEGTSSLTILMFPGNYKLEAADAMPVFSCPTVIKSSDEKSPACIAITAKVQFSGNITFDYIDFETNAPQPFVIMNGAVFKFLEHNTITKAGGYIWCYMTGENIADVTIMTGNWDYIYATGAVYFGGDASALIVCNNDAGVEGFEIPEVSTVINTTGTVNRVFGTGMGGGALIGKTTLTLINGTVGQWYCGGHCGTSGGVAYETNRSCETKEAIVNICGGTITTFFSTGTRDNKYSDGTPVENDIKDNNIKLTLYGADGKAAYEAAEKQGPALTPVISSDELPPEPKEEDPKEEDPKEEDPKEEDPKPAETGDTFMFVVIALVASLGGALIVKKVR